jgi:hypothetical protein
MELASSFGLVDDPDNTQCHSHVQSAASACFLAASSVVKKLLFFPLHTSSRSLICPSSTGFSQSGDATGRGDTGGIRTSCSASGAASL